jgi:hypothetical protein
MATLDNFQTGNRPERFYPTTRARNCYIYQALNQNHTWDPANEGPVAPAAAYDPAARTSAHIDGPYEERLTTRSMKDYLVPTQPQTRRKYNDTVSGVQLIQDDRRDTAGSWWSRLLAKRRAAIPTYSRFHPYLR